MTDLSKIEARIVELCERANREIAKSLCVPREVLSGEHSNAPTVRLARRFVEGVGR